MTRAWLSSCSHSSATLFVRSRKMRTASGDSLVNAGSLLSTLKPRPSMEWAIGSAVVAGVGRRSMAEGVNERVSIGPGAAVGGEGGAGVTQLL